MAKHFFGEFNRNGYSIYCKEEDLVYSAGNCKYDSAQYLRSGVEGTLDIVTIEEYCESTGKEITKEHGGIWTGCRQIDDDEEPDDAGDYEIDRAVGFDPDICGD